MLPIAIGRAVVLIVLVYLSAGCCCHYIPYKENEPEVQPSGTLTERNVQICGAKLTSLIISFCGGYLISPTEENGQKSKNDSRQLDVVSSGVVERCCKNVCDWKFLTQHCGGNKTNITKMFQSKRDLVEPTNELMDHLPENRRYNSGTDSRRTRTKPPQTRKNKIEVTKVRLNQWKMKNGRKNRNSVGRKKRKPHFKWDCVYKSFGHYLLKLDHDDRFRNKIRKREDQRLQPIEVGTISPITFGGDPVVVAPRHHKSLKHRTTA